MIRYLIELRDAETGNCVGYVSDIDTAGTFDVRMTRDPNNALKFITRGSAQGILDDNAFAHAMAGRRFEVAEHMWMDGPAPPQPEVKP
jgi:hypothetical protein